MERDFPCTRMAVAPFVERHFSPSERQRTYIKLLLAQIIHKTVDERLFLQDQWFPPKRQKFLHKNDETVTNKQESLHQNGEIVTNARIPKALSSIDALFFLPFVTFEVILAQVK